MSSQPQSRTNYEFLVPGETTSLALIRWVVTRLASAAGLTEEETGNVEVAVDEACSNVLDHAYRSRNPKPPLHIVIINKKDAFTVDIIDEGRAFDFDGYTDPKFPDHWLEGHERGVGLFLIRQFMDEVSYEKLPNERNRMRLIKRRRTETTSEPVASLTLDAGPDT